jgi:hypothetical protein
MIKMMTAWRRITMGSTRAIVLPCEELVHGVTTYALKLDLLLSHGTNNYGFGPPGLQIR